MSERARLNNENSSQAEVSEEEQPIISEVEKTKKRELLCNRILYIILGFIIVGVITAVIVVLLLTYEAKAAKRSVQFNDIFNGTFGANINTATFSTNPNKENTLYYWKARGTTKQQNIIQTTLDHLTTFTTLENSGISADSVNQTICDIIKFNADTKQETVLITSEDLSKLLIPDCTTTFLIHSSERFISFELDIEHIWRHSTKSNFVIVDVVKKVKINLSNDAPTTKQIIMKWCSDNDNTGIATASFVQENNIYLHRFDTNSGETKDYKQITFDGSDELIFNGISDWLYEEEVIGGVDTYFFSPDCSKIVYLKLNDSQVPMFQLPDYEPDQSYTHYKKVRWPTPGNHNPIPSVHIYDIVKEETVEMDIGQIQNPVNIEDEYYVYDLMWASNSIVGVVRVDRYQNQKDVLIGDLSVDLVNSMLPNRVISTIKTTDCWIPEANGKLYFIPNTPYFVDIIPVENHHHLALFDIQKAGSSMVRYLTSGDFDVTQIYKVYSSNDQTIYYQTTQNTDGIQRQIYSINLDGTTINWLSRNISEPLTSNSTEYNKGFYDVSFSVNANYLVLNYYGPLYPFSKLYNINEITKKDGYLLTDNTKLQQRMEKEILMPKVKVTQIENDNKDKVNVMLYYPPSWNGQSDKSFPLLVYSYGGPGSQLVDLRFSSMHNGFSVYLASLGFIVATIDGRGTGFRGRDYMCKVYKNLGYYEVLDQISVTKQLRNLPYVDSSRIAIWGWSFGGYLSSRTITFSENITATNDLPFQLALSVAPVTDWIFYDTAYTERYMLWPNVNSIGYKASSVLTQVQNPKCPILPTQQSNLDVAQSQKKYVLCFGTADDNVHPLNSFNLMKMLQDRLVQFDLMVYTNKDHSIDNRKHIYKFLSNKLGEYFGFSSKVNFG
ncbi:hypothetical protein ABK040_006098 [Willaertia magna]